MRIYGCYHFFPHNPIITVQNVTDEKAYSDLLSKFGEISFQEFVSEWISHPIFYGDLVYKLRRVECEAHVVL